MSLADIIDLDEYRQHHTPKKSPVWESCLPCRHRVALDPDGLLRLSEQAGSEVMKVMMLRYHEGGHQ